MNSGRSNLAISSWQKVRKQFRKYPVIIEIIDFVQGSKFDSFFYASSSLESLNISPKHRYDAKVDVLNVTEINGTVTFIYYDIDNMKTIKTDHEKGVVLIFEEYFQKLKNKYCDEKNL